MPDITLEHRNGKIVGIDSNGNEVPIQMGDVDADSLSGQRGLTKNLNVTIRYVNQFATSGDGTQSNPWVDGFNAALDSIPSDTPGVLVLPSGNYEISAPVEVARGVRKRLFLSAESEEYVYPTIVGSGRWSTTVRLQNGVDDHMFTFGTSENVPTDYDIIGGGMYGLTCKGNKGNNTGGDCIHIENRTDAGDAKQLIFQNLYLRQASRNNFNADHTDFRESDFVNVTFNRAASQNVKLGAIGRRTTFERCRFNFAGDAGIDFDGADIQFDKCEFFQNSTEGCVIRGGGDGSLFTDCYWIDNSTSGDNPQIFIRASNCKFDGQMRVGGNSTNAIFSDGGSDNSYNFNKFEGYTTALAGTPTRAKWNSILFGGPFGGSDISSLTGASVGDMAMSDGTTQDSDSLWILKSSGDWQAVHDPTITVTPS